MENLDRENNGSFINLVVREETLRPGVVGVGSDGLEPFTLSVTSESHTLNSIAHGIYMARLAIARRILDTAELLDIYIPEVPVHERTRTRGASTSVYSENYSIQVGFVDLTLPPPREVDDSEVRIVRWK